MFFSANTIFTKMFRVIFIVIVSFGIISSIYFISKQKTQILNSLESESHSIAKMITYASSDAIVLNEGSYIVEFNYELLKETKNLVTLILSRNNNSNYIIRKDGWSFEKEIDPIFKRHEKSVNSWQIIFSPISNKKVFHYTFPIIFNGTSWGWLHLNMSLNDYEEKITNMYFEFFTFFTILLLGFFILSYIIAKNFSKPIIDLNNVANKIFYGYLNIRSNYKSNDEIGQLANSFNKMISKIQETQKQLTRSYEELELRVKDRTLELYETNKKLEDNKLKLEELNLNLDKKVKEEIEKRREHEVLLIQQSKLASMGEMLRNIAHQWRQPLSVVTTAATGIKVEKEFNLSTEDREIKKLNTIIKASNFLSQTIEDFTNFFKPNKEVKKFDLKQKVEQSLSLVSSSLDFYHIKVEKKFKDNIEITGYENEYSQVILNILNNAKDVLVERKIQTPLIKLRSYEKENFGYLEIEDNAGGIKDEILEKIFEPYFTTKHQSQGTGIGLYMSKMIIEQNMLGKLQVENSKNGAIFIIAIPIL